MSSSDKETELKILKEDEKLLSEQLSFFRKELYITSSPGVQFELKKKIEESQQQLDEIKSQIATLEKPPSISSVPKGPSYVYTISCLSFKFPDRSSCSKCFRDQNMQFRSKTAYPSKTKSCS
jgi:hypothetical protein